MEILRPIVEFCSFFVSIFAAILALQLYALLKTGEIGKTWRVLIVGAIVFAIHALIGMARAFEFFDDYGTYEITQLLFVVDLSYAFWLQRSAFYTPEVRRPTEPSGKEAFPSRFDRLHLRRDLLEEEFDLPVEPAHAAPRQTGEDA